MSAYALAHLRPTAEPIEQAREWYDSPAYQDILRLRADHIPGDLVLVDGTEPDHDSAAMAAAMRAAANR
ncbi:DUF1330 domain-containing protein [Nonomuraea sp. NPDC050153]|uniref:DUF1330 domain-containing protein n=1 Tax=Nonomuraea sp. NPDC050153 TaxID=3364359 RepID=UPI003792EEBC